MSCLLQPNYFRFWVPREALNILSSCSPPTALLIIIKLSLENLHSESNKPKPWKVALNNPMSWTWGQHSTPCRPSRAGWVLGDCQNARPWRKPTNNCWCIWRPLWGSDTTQCTEPLQKPVPRGITGLQWSKESPYPCRQEGICPHGDRSSSRCARGSGGSVSTAHCWPGRRRLAFSSILLRKCKNFQWGHRWPLRAKGLRKQLLAHTNIQQPKKYPFAHAIIC